MTPLEALGLGWNLFTSAIGHALLFWGAYRGLKQFSDDARKQAEVRELERANR